MNDFFKKRIFKKTVFGEKMIIKETLSLHNVTGILCKNNLEEWERVIM